MLVLTHGATTVEWIAFVAGPTVDNCRSATS